MPRIPIACSLEVDAAVTRVAEWRAFMGTKVVGVTRTPGCLRLRLVDDDETVIAAADLGRREKACCAFFDVSLALLPDAVWLVVEAPDEAASLLDDLASLPTSEE